MYFQVLKGQETNVVAEVALSATSVQALFAIGPSCPMDTFSV